MKRPQRLKKSIRISLWRRLWNITPMVIILPIRESHSGSSPSAPHSQSVHPILPLVHSVEKRNPGPLTPSNHNKDRKLHHSPASIYPETSNETSKENLPEHADSDQGASSVNPTGPVSDTSKKADRGHASVPAGRPVNPDSQSPENGELSYPLILADRPVKPNRPPPQAGPGFQPVSQIGRHYPPELPVQHGIRPAAPLTLSHDIKDRKLHRSPASIYPETSNETSKENLPEHADSDQGASSVNPTGPVSDTSKKADRGHAAIPAGGPVNPDSQAPLNGEESYPLIPANRPVKPSQPPKAGPGFHPVNQVGQRHIPELPVQHGIRPVVPLIISDNDRGPGSLLPSDPGPSRNIPDGPPALDMPLPHPGLPHGNTGQGPDGSTFGRPSGLASQPPHSDSRPVPPPLAAHRPTSHDQSLDTTAAQQISGQSPISLVNSGDNESARDLRALAQALYPFIRRMIIIDKERLPR